jgi:four helix bundle protein
MSSKDNVILNKSYAFALEIISIYKVLKQNHEYDIGRQILRSGTSIGANINEATAAQSKKDFISKMAIASKEARETRYWLNLIRDSKMLEIDYNKILKEMDEIISILTAIVKTSQQN